MWPSGTQLCLTQSHDDDSGQVLNVKSKYFYEVAFSHCSIKHLKEKICLCGANIF